MDPVLPHPELSERPTAYAERLGRWHAERVSAEHRRRFGQYVTSVEVADFMASLCGTRTNSPGILDPGAGSGVLACAVCERLSGAGKNVRFRLVAYEADEGWANVLSASLSYLRSWLWARGGALDYSVRLEDFVLAASGCLAGRLPLFGDNAGWETFDVIISNPPYFKLAKTDPRAEAAARVVHGQPNIYALFMAISASLLNPGGTLVFITPRSFASGPYFRLFRRFFFEKVRPEAVHVFASRREAFRRDDVLQENVILKARRIEGWRRAVTQPRITVSSSSGAADLAAAARRTAPLSSMLDIESDDAILKIPVNGEEERIIAAVGSWRGCLAAYGLEVSTGPIVPFRTSHLLSACGDVPETHAPLLWMQNVRPMAVLWPLSAVRKPQYVRLSHGAFKLLVPDRSYVLVRRFSAKEEARRLTAAPLIAGALDSGWIGLENHLNYVYRLDGSLTQEEAWGLAAVYNSPILDTYFRTLSGNTQVSAAELRTMPLPPWNLIVGIGRRIRRSHKPVDHVVAVTASALSRISIPSREASARWARSKKLKIF